MRALLLIAVMTACAPDIPSVHDRAHAADLLDQSSLEHQLVALPGVNGAHALLHRAVTDPLTGATSPASASIVVTFVHGADRAAIESAAHQLVPTATIVLAEAPTAPAHKPVLAIAVLAVILGAAGYVAWTARPRT